MKKILCGALSLLTATVFAVWQDDHLPEIFALNAEKLQPVTLAQDWTFREGMPEDVVPKGCRSLWVFSDIQLFIFSSRDVKNKRALGCDVKI